MADPTGQSYVAAFGLALKGAETIKNIVSVADAKKQAAELYQIILAGQASALEESLKQRALLETVRDLEEKLRKADAWNAERLRYVLAKPWAGAVVYALKKSAAAGEPAHYLCTHCYADGKKSVLNLTKNKDGWQLFACRCGAQLLSPYRGGVAYQYAEKLNEPKKDG